MKRAGFDITNSTPGEKNPVYLVKYSEQADPIRAYSKIYSADGNPKENFVALMTCDHADQNCPVVEGSVMRVPVHYVDPKISDGSDAEAATYDERCHQIAREMFFMMKQVNN
jgi:arsenate reductase